LVCYTKYKYGKYRTQRKKISAGQEGIRSQTNSCKSHYNSSKYILVALEVLAAALVIALHILLLNTSIEQIDGIDSFLNIGLIFVLIFGKTIFLLYIIMQWLNEYYEITTTEVVHKKGFLTRKEQRHKLEHIGKVNIEQGIFGRIFNFGTLRLFNWTTEKEVFLYLIHNPMKYQHILQELLPEADQSRSVFREHILEPDQE